LTYLNIVELTV